MTKPDPLEGFQITDYNADSQTVTIELHPYLLREPKSQQAMIEKCIAMIEHGPGVSSVDVKPRDTDGENSD